MAFDSRDEGIPDPVCVHQVDAGGMCRSVVSQVLDMQSHAPRIQYQPRHLRRTGMTTYNIRARWHALHPNQQSV
ncbi:hypothetical protein FIBSPDRAFT_855087, partial [Athelia psychrophila]